MWPGRSKINEVETSDDGGCVLQAYVFKRDGKYYQIEINDMELWEGINPDLDYPFFEVEPYEETVTKYRRVWSKEDLEDKVERLDSTIHYLRNDNVNLREQITELKEKV